MHNAGVQKRAGKWVLLSPALRFRTTVGMGGWVGEASRFRSDLARWPESQAVNLQLHSSKRKSFRILITLFWRPPPQAASTTGLATQSLLERQTYPRN